MHTLPYLRMACPNCVVQIEVFLEGLCNSSDLVPGKEASAPERFRRRAKYSGLLQTIKETRHFLLCCQHPLQTSHLDDGEYDAATISS
jgi:hypothetical protein